MNKDIALTYEELVTGAQIVKDFQYWHKVYVQQNMDHLTSFKDYRQLFDTQESEDDINRNNS